MNYQITPLPKSEVVISVVIPFDEFEPHLKQAAVLISEEIEIEGFRKGKAPYDIVKNRVGEHAIYERAAELAVRHTYRGILSELGTRNLELGRNNRAPFTPIGKPEITLTKLAPGNELCYKVRVTLLPEVVLPDYKAIAQKIRAKEEEQRVSDEEADAAIQWLRESRTQLVTVGRSAAEGDRVEVDFEIRPGGVNPHTSGGVGVKIAEGDSQNHPVVIGGKKFIPGFEEALVGMKAGEQKSFTLTAPEDWREKSLAGRTLDFTATMKLVQERRIPELNDEFAKGIGNFTSIEALKTNVKEGLLSEKNEKETQRVRGLIIASIAAEASTDVPDVLVSAEQDKMIAQLQSGTTELGMKWEDYLLHIQKNEANLRDEWREDALRRVRIALCLGEIAAKERLDPPAEEITERANRFLQGLRARTQAERSIDPAQLREYTKGVLRNEKVFEFLENA